MFAEWKFSLVMGAEVLLPDLYRVLYVKTEFFHTIKRALCFLNE